MHRPIVEIAAIRLKPGVSEAELLAASDRFQQFLRGVGGCVRRELLKQEESEYADLVHWRSRADADAMMIRAATSSECMAYFSLMDMEDMDPAQGVRHFTTLATYGEE